VGPDDFILWHDVQLREIRKDNLCWFAYPRNQRIVINLEPAHDWTIRIKTDEWINKVINGILNIHEGRQ